MIDYIIGIIDNTLPPRGAYAQRVTAKKDFKFVTPFSPFFFRRFHLISISISIYISDMYCIVMGYGIDFPAD